MSNKKNSNYDALGMWVSVRTNRKSPFSELELRFMQLAIDKIQRFIDSDEPREIHKPVLQSNIDRIKRHISSTEIVRSDPSFQGRYFWDEYRLDLPPKGGEHGLTTTLSSLFTGFSRIVNEEHYLHMLTLSKLTDDV